MARHGKIARLPLSIRTQLNTRLQDGEEAKQIVGWLNSLPAVQKVLAQHFQARPINEPNLSEWRHGGFAEWLAHENLHAHTLELADRSVQLPTAAPVHPYTDHLAAAVAFRLAALLARPGDSLDEQATAETSALTRVCRAVVHLRRSEHENAQAKRDARDDAEAHAEKQAAAPAALLRRQKDELAAPYLAIIKNLELVAPLGNNPLAAIVCQQLLEIELCRDPENFVPKAIFGIFDPKVQDFCRKQREAAQKAQEEADLTPTEAAIKMAEQFDEYIYKRKGKARRRKSAEDPTSASPANEDPSSARSPSEAQPTPINPDQIGVN